MKAAISKQSGVYNTTGAAQWIITGNHEQLLNTLSEAASRSARQQCSILASFTYPVEWRDTICIFTGARQAGLGECFFWELPVAQNALIGVGAATTIETHGATHFTDAASAWHALLDDAVITYAMENVAGTPTVCLRPSTQLAPDRHTVGVPATSVREAASANSGPVLFGGFTFDPLSPRTQLWTGFPDGLLILPQILLSYSAGQTALTVNRMVQATDDIEQCAQEIEAGVKRLQDAVEAIPEPGQEEVYDELSLHEILPASEWMKMVADAVDMIRQGAFEKVVLARDIQVTLNDPPAAFDISSTLQRLRESYPTAYVFAVQRGERFFVGATPERLVQARDGQIHTMALAGSARRGESAEEDARIGMELLQSEKNNHEHALVVAMVREALKKHCTNVQVSGMPQLLRLRNVQHLQTPITGELISGRCILDLMADLHPTPAVGGFPRQAALEAIRNTEKLDRGWYAAPLGWVGASGHGEFAVALRSGLIEGNKARLFAGCGIVAHSDPQAEFAESCLKFQVMLRALSGWN